MQKIAEIYGVCTTTIFKKLKKHGIPSNKKGDYPRTEKQTSHARKLGKAMKGKHRTEKVFGKKGAV